MKTDLFNPTREPAASAHRRTRPQPAHPAVAISPDRVVASASRPGCNSTHAVARTTHRIPRRNTCTTGAARRGERRALPSPGLRGAAWLVACDLRRPGVRPVRSFGHGLHRSPESGWRAGRGGSTASDAPALPAGRRLPSADGFAAASAQRRDLGALPIRRDGSVVGALTLAPGLLFAGRGRAPSGCARPRRWLWRASSHYRLAAWCGATSPSRRLRSPGCSAGSSDRWPRARPLLDRDSAEPRMCAILRKPQGSPRVAPARGGAHVVSVLNASRATTATVGSSGERRRRPWSLRRVWEARA